MKNDKQDGSVNRDDKKEKHQRREEIEESEAVEENAKTQELEQQIEELEDKWKRALADYRNLESRVRNERQEWVKSANKDLLLRLLPILDTLLLAHQHTKDQSLQVTAQQFLDVLKAEGVTRIDTKNKEFDPMSMECIAVVGGEENKVVDEMRAGYMLHDKVLRPAQVRVGRKE